MCIFVTIVPGVVIISNTSCYLFKVRSEAGVLSLSLLTGQTNSFIDNVSSFKKSLETGVNREHLKYISHKNINIPPALSFVWDLTRGARADRRLVRVCARCHLSTGSAPGFKSLRYKVGDDH